jgi:hypothetical protein
MTVQVKLGRQPSPVDRPALQQTLVNAVRAIPGVTGAAFGGGLAQTDVRMGPFAIEGPAGLQLLDLAFCETPFVGADHFRVARISTTEGRTFAESGPSEASELVVNKAFARRFWPNGRAVGARLRIGEGPSAAWLTVVGIAGDVHLPGTNGDLFNLQMYRPTSAARRFVTNIVLRVSGGAAVPEPLLRRAVEGAGISAKIGQVWMTEAVIDRRVFARPRFAMVVFGVFAMLAVAGAGLFGVIAYSVT